MKTRLASFISALILVFAAILGTPLRTVADVRLDLESGLAASGYNDVRYPGTTGTWFSLSRDLSLGRTWFWRARVSYTMGDRHTVSILAAPLRLNGDGVLAKDLTFGDATFLAMTRVTTTYRFDSYRLTYRYDVVRRDNLRFGIGFTGKVRDAAISLQGGGLTSEKANTGFVPLINFRFDVRLSPRIGLLVDGDALAAPQGRVEDLLAAVTADVTRCLTMKIGYRVLEGGADNDEIYTFALVNYLVVGAVVRF